MDSHSRHSFPHKNEWRPVTVTEWDHKQTLQYILGEQLVLRTIKKLLPLHEWPKEIKKSMVYIKQFDLKFRINYGRRCNLWNIRI